MRRLSIVFVSAAVLLWFVPSWGIDGETRVGRYRTVEPVATVAQADPLAAVIELSFPRPTVSTVGQALEHLLVRSGYRLAGDEASDPAMQVLLALPLPEIHRRLGPITLRNAFQTLAGEGFRLVLDPVYRLVSFELVDAYAAYFREAGL